MVVAILSTKFSAVFLLLLVDALCEQVLKNNVHFSLFHNILFEKVIFKSCKGSSSYLT